jgi:hypothetical protein
MLCACTMQVSVGHGFLASTKYEWQGPANADAEHVVLTHRGRLYGRRMYLFSVFNLSFRSGAHTMCVRHEIHQRTVLRPLYLKETKRCYPDGKI